MFAEQLIFTILAFILFVYTFFKMIKENPEQARQLAKAANYPVTW